MKIMLTAAALAMIAFAATPVSAMPAASRADVAPQLKETAAEPVHYRRRYRVYSYYYVPYVYVGPRYYYGRRYGR